MTRVVLLRIFSCVAAVSVAAPTWALPITIVPESVTNLLEHRGVNDHGANFGQINVFGASIVPATGSTITAVQGGVTVGPRICAPTASSPDNCRTGFFLDSSRLGSWLLTFTNGGDAVTVATPTLAGAEVLPLATNVRLTGGGSTPTFRFEVPAGFIPDATRINILDKSVDLPGQFGGKDVIDGAAIPSGARSYTVPAILSSGQRLRRGRPYVLGINLIKLRPQFSEADFVNTNNTAMILSRSQSFFEFMLLPASAPQEVFLPSVSPDENPNDDRGPVHHFAVDAVGPDRMIFIDPVVAVGYDYAVGAGDPNFAAVLLPDVGGGQFTVTFGATTVPVAAGAVFTFPTGGVPAFSVRGIAPAAGLDPASVTAFITGLTFVQAGRFTGTMTPVVGPPVPTTAVAAVLPGSRAVMTGTPATAFATMLAASAGAAVECAIAPLNAPAGTTFSYQQTDADNVPVGNPNTPGNIPAGGAQTFVFSLRPSQPFPATEIQFSFDCANTPPAPVTPGVNTFLLTSSAGPTPDIIAIAVAVGGTVTIPGVGGTGALAVATANVGASAPIVVTADTGAAQLPLTLTLCQTNPAAQCINPTSPASSVTLQINGNETPTFSIFAQASGAIPFNPGVNRINVRYKTQAGGTVGSTSVAVQTQ